MLETGNKRTGHILLEDCQAIVSGYLWECRNSKGDVDSVRLAKLDSTNIAVN